MEKIKKLIESLESKDWEVIGFVTVGTLCGTVIIGATATAVVTGIALGLALRGKVSL